MKNCLSLAVIVLSLALNVAAEVRDSSATGFTVKTTLAIQATPSDVYRRLIAIGDWWGSDHTYSGSSRNMSIEEKVGGCWCEKLPDGGALRHAEVIYYAPGKLLRMTGGLGPLQELAAVGTLSVQLTPANGGTKLEMTYAVAGHLPTGLGAFAAPVDSVMSGQFARLKNFIETGNAESPQKSSMAK